MSRRFGTLLKGSVAQRVVEHLRSLPPGTVVESRDFRAVVGDERVDRGLVSFLQPTIAQGLIYRTPPRRGRVFWSLTPIDEDTLPPVPPRNPKPRSRYAGRSVFDWGGRV